MRMYRASGGSHAMGMNTSKNAKCLLLLSAALAVALTGTQASAQIADANSSEKEGVKNEGLQEIIVTARKHAEDIQDVAISMTALTGADLDEKGLQGFRDWSHYVPNLTMFEGQSANRRAGPTAVIRGVSQTGGGQLNELSSNATTSYMIGQVPIFSSDPGLYDLNRIEVLKGPQGTLFGIASMGGSIRFIPNMPSTEKFEGNVESGGGSIIGDDGGNTVNVSGMVNIPINDVLAVRFAGLYNNNGGYIGLHKLPLTDTNANNIVVSGNAAFDPRATSGPDYIRNANQSDETAARFSLLFTPTKDLSVNVFAAWEQKNQANKGEVDWNDRSQGWTESRFLPEPEQDEFKTASLEASWDLGFGRVEYVGGAFNSHLLESTDSTIGGANFLNGRNGTALQANPALPPDPAFPSAIPFPFATTQRITTNELRLQREQVPLGFSLLSSPVTFDYVLGGFYMTENRIGSWTIAAPTWNANRGPNSEPILTDGGLIFGQSGGGNYYSKAGFADLSLNLTRQLTVEGGIRYSFSRRDSVLYGWGDVYTVLASNGGTVGDNLNAPTANSTTTGSTEIRSVTPRYSLKYKIDDQRMAYFTAAKGERMPSGFGAANYWQQPGQTQNSICQNLARQLGVYQAAINGPVSDSVWSYDLGFKSTWLDKRLQLDVAVYDLEWTNLQNAVQLSQYSPNCNLVINGNFGKVRSRGAELELAYVPIDPLSFNAAVGYTDAKIAGDVPGVFDSLGHPLVKGDSIGNVTPLTASAGLEYRFPIKQYLSKIVSDGGDYNGFIRFDERYVGKRLGQNIGNEAQLEADPTRSQFISGAYALLDTRIGAAGNVWSGAFYCTNVTNRRAMFESFHTAAFPNQQIVSVNQPRTIGFTVKRSF
jgi:iron complex outermembrane receptor protein